ncbi:MAG: GNAT family N-acetyltransferase [Rhodobacterales bacterium]|nr:MAG: GNAT family N-acetyltransferase [Rhodobacterales bacterium]
MIVIEPGNPKAPEIAALLRESQAMMEANFPSNENHYLTPDELSAPDIHFFAARKTGRIVGTGALAVRDGYGEIKSMFVAESARGMGVADALMRQLEDQARALQLPWLRLETGNSLNSALRLYARHGFEMCGPFGAYTDSATSLFLEKRLSDA